MRARFHRCLETWWRSDGWPTLLCIFCGALLALWPHFASWARGDGLMWVGTFDEFVFYLRYTSPAFWFHPGKLADPLLVGSGVTHFPAVQFLPAVWLAKLAGWGPLGVTLAWRLWAALALPLGVYALVRALTRRPWWAAAVTIVFLADQGAVEARPIIQQLSYARTACHFFLQPEAPPEWPIHLLQWRIINPAVSLWALLAYLATLVWALRQKTTRANLAAGIALGLLFYAYFYYWTAAGLGLGLLLLLQPWRWRQCLFIGTSGVLIGLPQLLGNWLVKHSTNGDWLARQDYFLYIPKSEPLIIPWGTMLLWGVAWGLVLWRHRDLLALWCAGFAGFVLYNQSKFTRLLLQDGHWAYVWCFGLYLLLAVLTVRELAPRLRAGSWYLVGWAGIMLHFCLGLCFRHLEATRSRESIEVHGAIRQWRRQFETLTAPRLDPRGVTAGAVDFVNCGIVFRGLIPLSHMTYMAASMDNEDWHRRVALDGWLQGMSAAEFGAWQESVFAGAGVEGTQGIWSHEPLERQHALDRRVAAFAEVQNDPAAAQARYGVRYLALKVEHPVPPQLGSKWRLLQAGPVWRVWERVSAGIP